MLWVISDDAVPERLIPAAVRPLERCPEPVTVLLEIVMWFEDATAMPEPVVDAILKPSMTM